jgi:dGTP triphosphohydrolase
VVCDYVSGMTDRYAMQAFEALFVPRIWSGPE